MLEDVVGGDVQEEGVGCIYVTANVICDLH